MIFTYLDICTSLLPIAFFFFLWSRSKSETGIRIAVLYSSLFFLVNLIVFTWKLVPLLYEAFTLVEYLLFSAFLSIHLKSEVVKKLLGWSCILFSIFFITFILLTKGVAVTSSIPYNTVLMDSVPIGVETILILSFSFYYLYEKTNDTTTLFIYNTYQFWIVLGIVLYLAGSFFIYILANYIDVKELRRYWVITNIFSIIRSIFFVIAILVHVKPKRNTLIPDLELTYLN